MDLYSNGRRLNEIMFEEKSFLFIILSLEFLFHVHVQ